MNTLQYKLEGDTHVVFTRKFSATPAQVYAAHIDPEIVRRWMLGPDGWSMPVCEMDVRPGGKYHYRWENPDQGAFDAYGTFLELEAPNRMVMVEIMHLPDPTPENHVEIQFDPTPEGTLMTMRMTVPSSEIRAMMLETGMADGMEKSFARLESISFGAQQVS